MFDIIPNWHPVFVHFSVAAITLALALLVSGAVFRKSTWSQTNITVGYWNLWIGALISVFTVIAGFIAYNTVAHDGPSHAAMTDHRNWALVTFTVIVLVAAYGVRVRKKGPLPTRLFLSSLTVAGVLVAITGLKGGELVYRYGLGVMSLPLAGGEGHEHHHDGGDHEHAKTVSAVIYEARMSEHDTPMEREHQHPGTGETISLREPNHDHSDHHAEHQHSSAFSGLNHGAAKAVLAFHQAIESGELQAARQLLDDTVMIFEGGGVERSAAEYADHHMKSDIKFLQSMTVTPLEHHVKEVGDMAVSMGRNRVHGTFKGKQYDREGMETMVLRRVDGKWRIVHIHWSN